MELLVYKASAGSGKTFTLAVEYIKHLIANPRAYRQILAVTFTNKATTEMKERILQQLYGIWQADPASDAYLKRIEEDLARHHQTGMSKPCTTSELRQRAGMALQYILHDYSRFRVETIDSFFQSVMRNLARELELSPNLNIELNNNEVLSDAVDTLIDQLTPTSPVLAWLLAYIDERIADDKRWNVSDEIKRFGRNIFDEGYIERGEMLRQKLRDPQAVRLYRDVLREMLTDALEQMKAVIAATADGFSVLSGDDNLAIELIREGGDGVISVASNLFPHEMVTMTHAALEGNWNEADRLERWFAPFFKACFCETNPIPIKTAMAHLGLCSSIFRLPLCEMESQEKKSDLFRIVDGMQMDVKEGRV